MTLAGWFFLGLFAYLAAHYGWRAFVAETRVRVLEDTIRRRIGGSYTVAPPGHEDVPDGCTCLWYQPGSVVRWSRSDDYPYAAVGSDGWVRKNKGDCPHHGIPA